jgi:hypothetical protein
MGAGKSHVIQWMSANGCFPLPDIVQIDPDLFKIGFPEWDAYVKADPLKVAAAAQQTLLRRIEPVSMNTCLFHSFSRPVTERRCRSLAQTLCCSIAAI